jgi:DNA replication protein DnaC
MDSSKYTYLKLQNQFCFPLYAAAREVIKVYKPHLDTLDLTYYSDRIDARFGASPRAVMEYNFHICRKYAEDFSKESGNLLFIGGTGLGKTHLSAAIAAAAADKGYSVAYETASHLFSKLEKHRFNPDEQSYQDVEKLNRCDLLIIDDLGTELPGNFVTAALYSLLNDRLLAKKPMVISTNLTVDELSRRYNPQIASRLQGSFNRLTFVGEDIRVQKSRGV